MHNTARQTRANRTITVDFQNEATYVQLLDDGKAFLECVLAFVLSLGFQLKHKATCRGGGCLTRHSHYIRVRLGGVTIWRIQCTTCRAVFTVLPHFILCYRQMHPEVARNALLATHGGLSLELCAVICHISPMALYRLVCALGQQSLVHMLTRCWLPLPPYFLADEKHSYCLTDTVYLPTIVSGRIIWHLGYTEHASAAAFTQTLMASFNARRPSRSRRTGSKGSSPMASTVPSRACGRCFLGHASAIVSVTRSTSSRRNLRLSHPQSAKPSAQSSTLCCPGRDNAKACACLRSASGYVTLLTTSPTQQGRPMASVYGNGFRTSCAVKSGKEECSNTVGWTSGRIQTEIYGFKVFAVLSALLNGFSGHFTVQLDQICTIGSLFHGHTTCCRKRCDA